MIAFLVAAAAAQAALAAPAAPTPPLAPVAASATCNEPVLLVVWIDQLDRTHTKAYGEALRSSGIVRRHGGSYVAVGKPDLLLEGDWPADRNLVIEEYPCMAALKDFWFSDEYQKRIKPLRENSGHYTIGVFKRYSPAPPK